LVDISQQECLASILEATIQYFTYRGVLRSRFNPFFVQPLMVLPARDGYIYCCIVEQAQWERFVEMLGNPEWATSGLFDSMEDRVENVDALEAFLIEYTAEHDVLDLYRETQSRRIPWAPVNTMETLAKSEHLAARGFFVKIDRPLVGELTYPGAPYDFEQSPWQLRRPAPLLGEHTQEVLRELGYEAGAITRLREVGVV
jgi:crotonobetainyl-CoA:carnitine CoA-transferase CaiB-like acyl-CoA transferase